MTQRDIVFHVRKKKSGSAQKKLCPAPIRLTRQCEALERINAALQQLISAGADQVWKFALADEPLTGGAAARKSSEPAAKGAIKSALIAPECE